MNDYQIAAYIIPCALRAANSAHDALLDTGTMIQLSGAVSSAAATYGVKKRKEMMKAALRITPDFKLIAEDFFQVLKEAPVIASAFRSKNYETIAEFIIRHKDLNAKQRLQLYREEYYPKSAKFWKGFRIVCLSLTLITVLLHISLILFNPESRKQFLDNWNEMKDHAAKLRKHARNFCKAVRFLKKLREKMK